MVLQAIAAGLDTPLKLCNYPGASSHAMAYVLRELWKDRYICRVYPEDRALMKIELLDKGREAIGMGVVDAGA